MTNHPLRELIADKKLLTALAKKYGTPLYIYSQDRLLENLTRLNSALKKHFAKYHICYAVKANSNPNLIQIMHDSLPTLGADCASPGEIIAAVKAGIAAEKCIYTGNYESPDDLHYAYESGISINLDDISSLERLRKIGLPERISYRLNPGFGRGAYPQITTGGDKSKFGVPRNKIVDAYRRARQQGIKRFGLQCMTGSGVQDKEYFPQLLSAILEAAGEIETALKIKMEYVSIGGGIGFPYRDDDVPYDLDRLMSKLSEIFYRHYDRTASDCPALWLEPGKYIVGDTGFILTRVTGIKHSYRTFIGLEAGMETLIRPALYDAYHRFLKVGEPDAEPVQTVDIAGRCCENSDRQAIDRPFPSVAEGNLVAIMDAGAYGFAMASQYNGRPRPAEILLKNNQPTVIRRRETIEDIYATCQV